MPTLLVQHQHSAAKLPLKVLFGIGRRCIHTKPMVHSAKQQVVLLFCRFVSANSATGSSTTGNAEFPRNSVCGPPLIRSPFDNPNRRLQQPVSAQNGLRLSLPLTPNSEPAGTSPPAAQSATNKKKLPPPPGFASFKEAINVTTIDALKSALRTVRDAHKQVIAITMRSPAGPIDYHPSAGSSSAASAGSDQDDNITSDQRREERERSIWKGMKWFGIAVGFSVLFGTVLLVFQYGPEPEGGDQYSDRAVVLAWTLRILDALSSGLTFMKEPVSQQLLPDPVKPPWHQPKYTVVIEMRNILVAPQWDYRKGHYYVKRPALEYFLDVVGYPNFEFVIYTSDAMMQAAPVIHQLDQQKNRINHSLFREHTKTKFLSGEAIKDLSRLNRDLSKVIYIDWDPKAFRGSDTVLLLPKWEGDMDDTSLVDLAELLKTIHLSDVDDVRPILQFYSNFDNPMAEFRRRAQTAIQSGYLKDGDQGTGMSKYRPTAFNAFGWRRQSRV